jgi:replicative DNA helicase
MYETKAERLIIGAILLSQGDYLADTKLKPDDFINETEREMFVLLRAMREAGEGIDVVTVAAKKPAMQVYLWECTGEVVTHRNADFYEQLIHDRNARVAMHSVGLSLSDAAQRPEDDVDATIDFARVKIDNLAEKRLNDPVQFVPEILLESVDHLNSEPDFHPSDWGMLNNYIGGFRPGALYIIGARPAVGKSVVAVNMAFQLAKHGAVSFHSLEMSKREIMNRLFASVCSVSMDHLEKRTLTPLDWERIAKNRDAVGRPIAIADKSGQTLVEVRAFARQVGRKQKLAGIVVDYLQLMQDTERGRSRYESVTAISNGLKILARDLEVPVIALAQLNRQIEGRKDSAPGLSDLRDSGAIEQDADVVILLNRERAMDDGDDEKSKMIFHIAKNRHGKTGMLALRFDGLFARVTESR